MNRKTLSNSHGACHMPQRLTEEQMLRAVPMVFFRKRSASLERLSRGVVSCIKVDLDVRYHAGSPEACTAHNPGDRALKSQAQLEAEGEFRLARATCRLLPQTWRRALAKSFLTDWLSCMQSQGINTTA